MHFISAEGDAFKDSRVITVESFSTMLDSTSTGELEHIIFSQLDFKSVAVKKLNYWMDHQVWTDIYPDYFNSIPTLLDFLLISRFFLDKV